MSRNVGLGFVVAFFGLLAFPAAAQDPLWIYPHGKELAPSFRLTDFDGDQSFELIFNNGTNGHFSVVDTTTSTKLFEASSWAWAQDVADFDGDGIEDVLTVTASRTCDLYSGKDFSVLHTFTPPSTLVWEQPFLVPDVTGDGLADLCVVANLFGLAMFASEDDHELWRTACGYAIPFILGDLDGDGAVELFARSPACNHKFAAVSSLDGSLVHEFDPMKQGLPYEDDDGDGFVDLLYHVFVGTPVFEIRSSQTGAVIRSGVPQLDLFAVAPFADVDGDGFTELLGKDSAVDRSVLISGSDLQTPLYEWSPVIAPGHLFPLQGERRFDGDPFEDFLFEEYDPATGTPIATHLRGGNDLWVRVRQTPDPSTGDQQIDVGIGQGAAGRPTVLAVVSLNGSPLFLPVFLGTFGSNGFVALSADVDASLAGNDLSVLAFGFTPSGHLADSAVFPIRL